MLYIKSQTKRLKSGNQTMIDKNQARQKGFQTFESHQAMNQDKDQKLSTLKKLIPELINSDNQLNIQALQDFIDIANTTSNNKGYELSFAGKGIARAKADSETNYELKYEAKQSKQSKVQTEHNSVCTQTNNIDKEHNFICTNNIIIRGDNLEVLKILKQNYFEKIKMIYIDPPYNTKSENFIYQDNFKQDEQDLINNFDLDEHTIDFLHNVYGTKSHSGWLSFMYPRLKLARDLLKDDGVIFISIDDNEQANLKIICDEIFGEENFVSSLVWKRRKTQANLTKYIAPIHEYIFMIAKNKECLEVNRLPLREEYVKSQYKNPDNDPRGLYRTKPLASPDNSPNKFFELDLRNGRKIKGKWRLSQNTYDEYLKENLIVIPNEGKGMPCAKIFLQDNQGQIPNSLLIDIATNEQGSKEIENIFGSNACFSFPKPTQLLDFLLKISTKPNDIILDFFAGSGTTGDAVMQLNNEDKGHRKFILVQWDELIKENTESYKFCLDNKLDPFISSITIERLNRAGNQLKENNKDKLLDIGYKVFSLKKKPKLVQNKQGLFDLAYKRTNTLDKLYNMLCLSAKPLHSKVLTLSQDKLYMIKDNEMNQSIFILDELNKQDLDILEKYKHEQIYIDAYANINLESWLNMQVSQKENVVVVY